MCLEKSLTFLFAVKTLDVCRVGSVNAFVVKTNPLESEVGIRRIDACTCVVAIARRMASVTATGLWSRAIARREARGSAWWPTSVRSMRRGGWGFTDKAEVVRLLLRADSCG